MAIINQVQLVINAVAPVILVLEEQIQTVSPVLLLNSISLNMDVLLHAQMDSQRMTQIFVIHAQNLLLKDANLAIQHARHALHFKYLKIQINAYFAILLASTLVVNAFVEMMKISG